MPKVLVIYDGDCAFCSSMARWAAAWLSRTSSYSPYQQLDLASYGLSESVCAQALQVVDKTGELKSGDQAVIQILKLANWPWRAVGFFLALPIMRSLTKMGYRWVAKNRFRLPGGTPTCKLNQ